MSILHALAPAARISTPEMIALRRNNRHLVSAQIAQELKRIFNSEFRIGRLYAKKEAIGRCPCKFRDVEYRMIGPRETIHKQDAEQTGDRGQKDHAFESDRDVRWPAIRRTASHVVGISYFCNPLKQDKAANSADGPA